MAKWRDGKQSVLDEAAGLSNGPILKPVLLPLFQVCEPVTPFVPFQVKLSVLVLVMEDIFN